MANLVDKINSKHIKKDIPEFRVGDTVRVDVWVKEGKKERIQAFEGLVIAKKGAGADPQRPDDAKGFCGEGGDDQGEDSGIYPGAFYKTAVFPG